MRRLGLKDPVVQNLLKLVENRDYRFSKQKCVVTGTKLVQDLGKRYRFHEVLASRDDHPALEGLRTDSLHVTDARVLRRIAKLTSFDGLIATLDLPARTTTKELSDPRLILCLDYIEDPGVLGTLLRTAVAFQWQAVYFLPNCMDPFDSRCIRASQGALFDMPHCRGSLEELTKLCSRRRLPLCVAHSRGVDIGSPEYQPSPNGMALLLRQEFTSPWAPPKVAFKVKVPDPWLHHPRGPPDGDAFDSRALDVAVQGGILMHHIKHVHYPEVSRSPFLASPRNK
eukprot:TRINITY_DN19090_c0_g1_i1.p1 TRINITY_DN19090_c0_g1~~TRINITY_DN19090_c0_g1_i1.p1  ORF type:complete len:300 (+),score=45.32 TRINITY_DN19090_c0_g1_i1:53-901(+)